MKKYRISCVLNILMAAAVLYALLTMMLGRGPGGALTGTGLRVFRFFTVDSNVLLMLAAAAYAVSDIRVISGKAEDVPEVMYIIKLTATVSVSVTMLVTVFFLAPLSARGFWSLFMGSNLYFHLLVPLTAVLTLILTEKRAPVAREKVMYCLIPTAVYALCYAANLFAHAENGKVDRMYDWYGFVQNGLDTWPLPVIVMLVVTLLAGVGLWKLSTGKAE